MGQSALNNNEQSSLLEKKSAYDLLYREWLPHLTHPEIILLGWLISNIVSRGRVVGIYSLKQLVNGVPKKDGGQWTTGATLCRRTLQKTIRSLADKGFIAHEQTTRGMKFEVNLSWGTPHVAEIINLKDRKQKKRPLFMRVQEEVQELRQKGCTPCTQGGAADATGGCSGYHPSIENYPEGTNNRERFPAAPETKPDLGLEKNTKRAEKEGTKRRAKKKLKRRETVFGLEESWRDGCHAGFENTDAPIWIKKEYGMVKSIFKKYEPGSKLEFIEWSACNWLQIVRVKFSWMKKSKAPQIPDIGFFCKFHRDFYTAYSTRSRDLYLGAAEGAERRIKEKMLNGLSREAATFEAAKDEALALDREDRQEDLELARSLYSSAEQALIDSRRPRPAYKPNYPEDKVYNFTAAEAADTSDFDDI